MSNRTFSRFGYGRTNSTEGGSLTGSRILTENDLRTYVPSIFAEAAHESRSDRYTYIPTINVVQALAQNGYNPVFACEAKSRDAEKRGYTKHMVRFRQDNPRVVAGATAEICMINSHDGSSAYVFFAGMFRFICANGLVCGEKFASVKLRHSGNVVNEAVTSAGSVARTFDAVCNEAENFSRIILTPAERLAFAASALETKYWDADANEGKGGVVAPIEPHQLLEINRHEDNAHDLFTTFNVVQEHLVRGGDRGRSAEPGRNGRRRRVTTRATNGIDGNVKLNRALWTLTEKMAELKA